MRHAAIAIALLSLSACRPRDPDTIAREADASAGLGRCTQEEPGTLRVDGNAVYAVDRAETADGAAEGRFAAVLTCLTPGPAGSAVTVFLPNLADSVPRPGRYRIRAAGVVPAPDSLEHLAWAEARFPARDGVTYRAVGGELVIERVEGEALVGSYLVALERADDGPDRGPARLVLGGGFASPRNRLPAAPGGGR